jgi:vacuolar-type H+-ATPase subunit E/Vma4
VALADILSALQRDGDEEVARIVATRDETTSEIVRQARQAAKDAEAAAATSRDAAIALETEVILHRAVLHVERRLQEAREVIFKEILGRAQDRFSRQRSDPAYPRIVDALVAECVDFLGRAEAVMADPRDTDVVGEVLERRGVDAKLEPTLETWGGVVATDGKGVFVRNTLEERLGRAEIALRRDIGDLVPGLRGGTEPGGAS